jgi:Phosphoglucomutase/phosphomannomutase, alpha/beta/alpha domain I
MAAGLASCGVSVARFGLATTPAMFMSTILPGTPNLGSSACPLQRHLVVQSPRLPDLSPPNTLTPWSAAVQRCRISQSCERSASAVLVAEPPTSLLRRMLRCPGYEYDGAIMITASHLPFNRNGMKFFTSAGGLEKPDISAILRLAAEESSRSGILLNGQTGRRVERQTFAAEESSRSGRILNGWKHGQAGRQTDRQTDLCSGRWLGGN